MSKVKIMIVEDELIAAESLALDLKRLGYEVITIVDSGEKALLKLEHLQPDLILMDIMLKGKFDGIITASEIQKYLDIPIIYLTAYGDTKTLERAKNTSPYGYLVKPYKSQDIRTTIEIALQKYQEQSQIKANLVKEKELQKVKNRALSAAAHEFKTPLTNILLSSGLLREHGEQFSQTKKDKYFRYIQSAIHNLNESVEDILIISQAEEGKIVCDLAVLDIVKVVQEAVTKFQNSLSQKHSLEFSCNCFFYEAEIDKKLWRHILNNLISNAIKYSPEGGKISVKLNCNQTQVSLSVEDCGIGIPDDYQPKLFQLFERADNVGVIAGTGLGLAIVKKAVDLHHGTIEVESQEGKGTKLTVTIPTNKT